MQYYALFDRKRNGKYFCGGVRKTILAINIPYDKI